MVNATQGFTRSDRLDVILKHSADQSNSHNASSTPTTYNVRRASPYTATWPQWPATARSGATRMYLNTRQLVSPSITGHWFSRIAFTWAAWSITPQCQSRPSRSHPNAHCAEKSNPVPSDPIGWLVVRRAHTATWSNSTFTSWNGIEIRSEFLLSYIWSLLVGQYFIGAEVAQRIVYSIKYTAAVILFVCKRSIDFYLLLIQVWLE